MEKALKFLIDEVVDWLLTIALLFGWDIQANEQRREEEIDKAMGVPRWGTKK